MPGRVRVAIYSRVSVDWQTTEKEIGVLKDIAAQRGWELGEIYVDNAVRGDQVQRRAFRKLLNDASKGQFASVMAWSIAELPQSVRGVCGFVAKIEALGIGQYYHQEGIDASRPEGRAMVRMCVMLSKLAAGASPKRVANVRPSTDTEENRSGRVKIDPQTEWAICQALASGKKGILKIAAEFSVSSGTVQRIKAEMNKLS
jgi:DNA invertase Pin-like site-specific DNA recombinase